MDSINKVRWTVKISRETDSTVRGYLADRGLGKTDISKFVEEAVRWRVLEQTIAEAQSSFSDMPERKLRSIINDAVQFSRVRRKTARRTRRAPKM
jgi:hypothetical protein